MDLLHKDANGAADAIESPQKKQKVFEIPRATFPVMTEEELKSFLVPYREDEQFTRELKSTLKEHGMAVVGGVLNPDECAGFEKLWKREKDEESALPCREFSEQGWWLNAWVHAHGELAWTARIHPRVQDIFARIYGTKDIACGLDLIKNFCVADSPAAADNMQWLHVDQNTLTGIEHDCYQSILYIQPSEGEARSTTVVWPGSHKDDGIYGRLIQDPLAKEKGSLRNDFGVPYGHYIDLSSLKGDGAQDILEKAVNGARRVPVPAGALLLWSSRTLHQGWAGGPRLAVPVCYEPKERVSPEARRRKVFMAAAGFPSSHSPSEGLIHPCVATRRGVDVRQRRPVARPFSVLPSELLPDADWDALWASWEGEQFGEDLIASMDAFPTEQALKPEVLAVM